MPIEWTEDLVLGVETIDSQHKSLIEKVGALLDSSRKSVPRDEAVEMVGFMRGYCADHFIQEESIMKKYGYPGLAEHIVEHEKFTKYFKELSKRVSEGGMTAKILFELNTNLITWLSEHIRSTDLEMCRFLKGKIS